MSRGGLSKVDFVQGGLCPRFFLSKVHGLCPRGGLSKVVYVLGGGLERGVFEGGFWRGGFWKGFFWKGGICPATAYMA